MPQIYLCFLWHMHQPFYKDLISGEYRMPWTRLHALKDYFGMVEVLREFPDIHQTFNLVPSLCVQVEEYAAGQAIDNGLRIALKPAETLTTAEQDHLLRNYLYVSPSRSIARFPRYAELCDAWRASDKNTARAHRFFNIAALRDLQVLSQLAWFDEEALEHDPEVVDLVRRGRNFTHEDQALIARKQTELLNRVMPVYREFAATGQIEISTTPLYHPILPLLCDSQVAEVSHPYVPLPPRFRYPQDAWEQLSRGRQYCQDRFGVAPDGLWPSEGSVSDEALRIAADAGFQWAGTDNGVLSRTLGRTAGVDETYRPYVWKHDGRQISLVFRDHYLSDLIGFVYSRMGAAEAAADFLGRIRDNCRGILASGRDAFVPVILDGENAWEFYERNGRPFLRELYRRISADDSMTALTISEALHKVEPHSLGHIFPGSWINANFDIWIGAEEDNRGWEYLLRARQMFDRISPDLPEDRRRLAYDELLIAEGSDWFWWYGPEHHSEFRSDFDELFRTHLANAYRAMGLTPPDELSRAIIKTALAAVHTPPTGPIRPRIDGEVTSYFEWLGAGVYRVDARSGAMHGKRFMIRELSYGSDGQNLYIRVDFEAEAVPALAGMEARFSVHPVAGDAGASTVRLEFAHGGVETREAKMARPGSDAPSQFAMQKVLEGRISLAAAGVGPGQTLRLQLSLWKQGLPLDSIPHEGWIEVSTAEPTDWPL